MQQWVHFLPMSHFLDSSVSFLGRFESLSEDFDTISRDLGVEKISLQHLNKTVRKLNFEEYYNFETESLVRDMYREDFKTFGY